MTRKILINGRREEELRVAIVENQTLEDFEIETKRSGLLRNNIYRGVVSNIAPSLNAAFVDFGESKNGFLAFNDVVESAYHKPVKGEPQRISEILVPGQPLIVQVIKDATGQKGAQVTTNISLAGRYLVLRPKDAKSGVSRKVDEDARADLTQKARSLDLPEGYGCIVRTNATDQPRAILLRDAKVLVQLWRKMEAEYKRGTEPTLLYNDQDIVVQIMRDYFDSTIHEVLIDNKSCYERARAYVHATVPGGEDRIKCYEDRMPLFSRYNLEKQINQIYARQVSLPSGGFIAIDPTEALTAIDVNSARSTKRETQDLTAYHTNIEAAVEIARQLRMRDIGGLIVIDFIDMKSGKHQRDVERVMRNAMSRDKARNKVERISANGLLEINRQRISQALSQRTHLQCPTCGGRGFVPTIEAMGLSLIREIEARAIDGSIGGVVITLHPDIAQAFQNARRHDIAQLEEVFSIRIEILASRDMSRGENAIEWLTRAQENELRTDRPQASASAVDAASIVDAVEAYNANGAGDDDSYRPNDFEEFSSEEARRKRAAKRARREGQASHSHAAQEQAQVHSHSRASQAHAAVSVSANVEIPPEGACCEACVQGLVCVNALGFAVLAMLVRHAHCQLEAPCRERVSHRRRPDLKRKGKCCEKCDFSLDVCLFVSDIIRAVCALRGIVVESSPRELAKYADDAVDWLLETAHARHQVRFESTNALLAQTMSRHARVRMELILGARTDDTIDCLGKALCSDRDVVFGVVDPTNDARCALTPAKLLAIDAQLTIRCQRIFAAESSSPLAVFNVEDSAQSKSSCVREESVRDVQKPALASASPSESGRQPRRTSRRGRIGSGESLFRDNNEVVVAEVPIIPMTMIEDSSEPLPAMYHAALSQAITQEQPAVRDDAGRRRRRKDRPERRRHEEVAFEAPKSEFVDSSIEAACSSDEGEVSRRMRRARRGSIGQGGQVTQLPSGADANVSVAQSREALVPKKDVRPVVLEQVAEFSEPEPALEPATVSSSSRCRSGRRRAPLGSPCSDASQAFFHDAGCADANAGAVSGAVEAASGSAEEAGGDEGSDETRSGGRRRQNRRRDRNKAQLPVAEAMSMTPAEVEPVSGSQTRESQEADACHADKSRSSRRGRQREEKADNSTSAAEASRQKSKSSSARGARGNGSAEVAVSAQSSEVIAEVSAKEEEALRSTRRVRKTKARAYDGVADDIGQIAVADDIGQIAEVSVQTAPMPALEIGLSAHSEGSEEESHASTRRVRRTRGHGTKTAPEASSVQTQSENNEAVAVAQEEHDSTDTPSRVRRTRRSRLGE
ncbi:MAG: Rne/Rng family ribonuclease [Proteobacteria bacterium]|nr:Rne/Rng family ribonuclease [Pseudomonadota bacterium]